MNQAILLSSISYGLSLALSVPFLPLIDKPPAKISANIRPDVERWYRVLVAVIVFVAGFLIAFYAGMPSL